MEFRKSLAKYYKQWAEDCIISAEYCKARGDEARAAGYLKNAKEYVRIYDSNKEAIEFFSVGDRAFLLDSALPAKFRGFK
jgi:hypothetical protein